MLNVFLRKIFSVLLVLLVSWNYIYAQNTSIITDKQRYLSAMVLNISNGEDWELNHFEKILSWGCNSAQITVNWPLVYPHKGAAADWSLIDKEIAIARKYNAKVALRISLSRRRVDTKGNEWWPAEAEIKDHHGDKIYDSGFPYSHQPTVAQAMKFIEEVASRYRPMLNDGSLLFLSAVYSPTQESGYHYENKLSWDQNPYQTLYDYSDVAVETYRNWLTVKYKDIKTLNQSWESDFGSFQQIKPVDINIDKPNVSAKHLDWYRFRHEEMKKTLVLATKTIKDIDTKYVVINEFGSIFDDASFQRVTFSFPDLCVNSDGIKINNADYFPHRFSADLMRTNMPDKLIMNEVFVSKSTPEWEVSNQFNSHYAHGCKLVTYVARGMMAKDNEETLMKSIFAQIQRDWLSKPMTNIVTGETMEVRLSEVFNNWNWYGDFVAHWTELFAKNPKPIAIKFIDDIVVGETNNKRPVLVKPLGDIAVVRSLPTTINVPFDMFTDPDGQIAKYEVEGLPVGLFYQNNGIGGVPTTMGEYTVCIRAYDNSNETSTHKFRIFVKEPISSKISLIDAGNLTTKKTVLVLQNNGSYNTLDLPADYLNIMAESSVKAVAVKLSIDGPITHSIVETDAPFLLFGDNGGSTFAAGNYTLKVDFYSSNTLSVADWLGANNLKFTIFEKTNKPPVVLAVVANQSTTQGSNFNFTIPKTLFTDADGTVESIKLTDLPLGLTQSGWSIIGTPTKVGNFLVTAQVYDNAGASAKTTFTITVNATNTNIPPKIVTPLPEQTTFVGTSFVFNIPVNYFADPDGYVSRLIASGLPPGLVFTSGSIAGRPTVAGIYNVVIKAIDNQGDFVLSPFKLTVRATNKNPIVQTLIPSQTTSIGQTFGYSIPSNTFTDPDGDILSLKIQGLPSGFSANGANIGGVAAVAGDYIITVVATDNMNASVSTTFQLSVKLPNENTPPKQQKTMPDHSFVAGKNMSLIIPADLFIDIDGYVSGMTVRGLPEGLSYAGGVVSGTPTRVGIYTITIKVIDNQGASAVQYFVLTVTANNGRTTSEPLHTDTDWNVYPNPVEDWLITVVLPKEYLPNQTSFALINMASQQFELNDLWWENNKVEIRLPNNTSPHSTYILHVKNEKLPSKSIKILKN